MAADIARPATGAPLSKQKPPRTSVNCASCWSSPQPRLVSLMKPVGSYFNNARLREILGYSQSEFHLFDTRLLWHDLDQRERIIEQLRTRGGQVLNEKVIWRTKKGALVHLLLSYVQVAYRGGHIGFVGGKRVLWLYDITVLTQREAQLASKSISFAKSWTTARLPLG